MKEPRITESEWKAELDRCRHGAPEFTEEQWKAIEYARDTKPAVQWNDLATFLKRRYNITIGTRALAYRYESRKRKEA
jgi:hypothetical protein